MTRTSRTAFALLSLVTAATPAFADDASDAAYDLEMKINAYGRQVDNIKDHWSSVLDERYPLDGCHAALKSAAAARVATTPEQKKTCDEFRTYHLLAQAEAAVSDAATWNYFLTQINMATNHEKNGAKMIESAQKCSAEVERLVAAGMPTNIKVRIGKIQPVELTMGEAKAKVCEPLAKAAASFAKDVADARTAAYEKAAAPYKKVGVTGDRLNLLVDHVNYAMYAVGGAELRTPMQLKNAKVIFELLGPGTDGLYILRRYQFSGDSLVSTTSREFLLRPGAKHFK